VYKRQAQGSVPSTPFPDRRSNPML